jgi:hypothetical protein
MLGITHGPWVMDYVLFFNLATVLEGTYFRFLSLRLNHLAMIKRLVLVLLTVSSTSSFICFCGTIIFANLLTAWCKLHCDSSSYSIGATYFAVFLHVSSTNTLMQSGYYHQLRGQIRGVLGNKCAGHHNLKTVKIIEIMLK